MVHCVIVVIAWLAESLDGALWDGGNIMNS